MRGWLARQKVKKMKLAKKQERIRQQQERVRLNKLKQQQQQQQQQQREQQQQDQQQQQQEYDSRQNNLVDNKVQENIHVNATSSSRDDSSFGGQWRSALGRFSMACVKELIKEIHGGGPLTYPGIPYLEAQDGLISRRRMPRVSQRKTELGGVGSSVQCHAGILGMYKLGIGSSVNS